MPMHVERDIVVPTVFVSRSVPLSVQCWYYVKTNGHPPLQNFKGNLSEGVKYNGVGKFC